METPFTLPALSHAYSQRPMSPKGLSIIPPAKWHYVFLIKIWSNCKSQERGCTSYSYLENARDVLIVETLQDFSLFLLSNWASRSACSYFPPLFQIWTVKHWVSCVRATCLCSKISNLLPEKTRTPSIVWEFHLGSPSMRSFSAIFPSWSWWGHSWESLWAGDY